MIESLFLLVESAECTRNVHGADSVRAVEQATRILFGAADVTPDAATIDMLSHEMPSSEITRAELEAGVPVADFLIRAGLAESKGAARKLVEGGGIYLNNRRLPPDRKTITTTDIEWPAAILARSGKKSYHLLRVL